MAPRRLLLLLVFVCGVSLHAEPTPPVTIPPEPQRPETNNLNHDHTNAAWDKWQADYTAWRDSLTPEQKAELKRRTDRLESEKRRKATSLPLPTDGYTWQQAAHQQKLNDETIALLSRDKIAYGPAVKQSFDPYLHGPVFITSDSLLNAFQVLFESTFRHYELRQITELRKSLESILTQERENLAKSPFPPTDMAPGWRQAQLVLGPALSLLGTPVEFFDPDARDEIQAQVNKIKAAAVVEQPAWLGEPTSELPAIDYRRCKPVGIYADDEKLSDYFRAVRWLQMIPFRVDRDDELVAIGLLSDGLHMLNGSGIKDSFRSYNFLLGQSRGLDLAEAADRFQGFNLYRTAKTWPERLQKGKMYATREVHLHGKRSNPSGSDVDKKRNAAIQFTILPEYIVSDTQLFQALADKNLEPEGLAVAALLGSDFACTHFSHFTSEQFETALTAGDIRPAKNHERDMLSLYDEYLGVLQAEFSSPDNDAPAFMRSEAWQAKSCQAALSGWAQMRHALTLHARYSVVYLGLTFTPPGFVEPNAEFFARMADLVEHARRLFDTDRDRWDALAGLTRKLETLVQKQLRQKPWTQDEEDFFRAYGARLGHIMGYENDSYESPQDDAPRWAEVHRNLPQDSSLAACVGRPRIIYVLYPWNGMEVLCQGSVMPYYEYHSRERLTDTEWKQLLDSPQAPAQPDWLQPYLAK